MMHQNSPAFVISFLAITKIGAIPSFINTSLIEGSLLHCIKIAKTRLFLFDPLYASQVATIETDVKALGVELYVFGEDNNNDNIDDKTQQALERFSRLKPEILNEYSSQDTDESYLRNVTPTTPAMLIYTR